MIIKKSLFTIIIFSFFLLFSNAAAAQEDFEAATVPSVELCPCSNQAYTVTVENTGSAASSYQVLANEDLSEWIKFSPNRFALNPGQKGSFSVIVNSACNIEDNFDLDSVIKKRGSRPCGTVARLFDMDRGTAGRLFAPSNQPAYSTRSDKQVWLDRCLYLIRVSS